MKLNRVARLMAGACLGAAAMAGSAHAGEWAFATGLNYTSGDYNETQDTTVYAVPFTAGYSTERWSFSASVPYISLEGSGNIIPGAFSGFGPGSGGIGAGGSTGGGGVSVGGGGGISIGGGILNPILAPPPPPPPGPPPAPVTIEEEGFGDLTLSASFTPFVSESGGQFSIGADVRLPTGDETRSLGAGETIAAISASYALPIGDQSAIYGAVGYQHAFDSEIGGAAVGFGAETEFTSFLLGASVDWSDASIDGVPSQSKATVYAGFDVTEQVRIALYALTGLTETSPNFGAGINLIWRP